MLHQRGITADFPLKALQLWKPNSVRIRSCLIKVDGMCALSWQGIVVLLSKNNLSPSGDGCPHAMLPRGPLPTGLIGLHWHASEYGSYITYCSTGADESHI